MRPSVFGPACRMVTGVIVPGGSRAGRRCRGNSAAGSKPAKSTKTTMTDCDAKNASGVQWSMSRDDVRKTKDDRRWGKKKKNSKTACFLYSKGDEDEDGTADVVDFFFAPVCTGKKNCV